MTQLHIQLTDELDRIVSKYVEEGRYQDASAVVCAALESLEREAQEDEEKVLALRQALEEGLASGIARGDVFARVKSKISLEASRQANP